MLYSKREALFAIFILAVYPMVVINNRFTFLEHGVLLFYLPTIISLLKYRQENRMRLLIVASIFAGLSFLNKESGISAVIFLVLFLIKEKRLRSYQLH